MTTEGVLSTVADVTTSPTVPGRTHVRVRIYTVFVGFGFYTRARTVPVCVAVGEYKAKFLENDDL